MAGSERKRKGITGATSAASTGGVSYGPGMAEESAGHANLVPLAHAVAPFVNAASDNPLHVVSNAHVHRAETARTILGLASDMIAAAGGVAEPPPLKFLVPFLEKCSLEDEDIDLQARWAALLSSASLSYDPTHRHFADVLDRLDPEAARFIDELYRDYAKNWPPIGEHAPEFGDVGVNLREFVTPGTSEAMRLREGGGAWASARLFPDLRRGCRKVFAAHLDAFQPFGGIGQVIAPPPRCAATLKALGLLQQVKSEDQIDLGPLSTDCMFKAHQLTDFAFDFLLAVTPRNLPRWLKPAAYEIVRRANEPPAKSVRITKGTTAADVMKAMLED